MRPLSPGRPHEPEISVFVPKPRRRRPVLWAALGGLAAAVAAGGYVGYRAHAVGSERAARFAAAVGEDGEAVSVYNEAKRLENQNDVGGAVGAYERFLLHPGSSAFVRLADAERKGGREPSTELADREAKEQARQAEAAESRRRLVGRAAAFVAACVDPSARSDPLLFTDNFNAACRDAGIDADDRTHAVVVLFRERREEMFRLNRRAETARAKADADRPTPAPAFADPEPGEAVRTASPGPAPPAERKPRPAVPSARDMAPTPAKPRYSIAAKTYVDRAKTLEKAARPGAAAKVYEGVVRDFPGTEQAIYAETRLRAIGGK